MSLTIATKAEQSLTLPVVLATTYFNKSSKTVDIEYRPVPSFEAGGDVESVRLVIEGVMPTGTSQGAVELLLLKSASKKGADLTSQEFEWIERAFKLCQPDFKAIEPRLNELDSHLTLRSHLVGYDLTLAELALWGVLRGNRAAYAYIKKHHLVYLSRWFHFIEESNPWLTKVIEQLGAQKKESKAIQDKAGASYDIALPNTERGVVTRFPPEPSGYLHIGHAKAALLNDYFAHEKYKGTLLVRFDDTNPSKEKEEFQDAIIEDLKLMGIVPDKTSFTSDYFEELAEYCVEMIKAGKAYADDTDQLTMKDQRWNGIASNRRERSAEESLSVFEEMVKGSEEGLRNCIRAKISIDNPNKAMRDPVIYRCNLDPHHRTGTHWKAYPTYDFCCPIVDSKEGVTHALRTNEYRDRNPQYQWMLDALNLRKVHIWDFARMNFVRTLLSKRKLTKLVDQGVVWGWDDPRFPTIRGIRRRGMGIAALREFILKQGPSRNIVNLDWTLFWATNRKYIDPIAPRFTSLDEKQLVRCVVNGVKTHTEDKPRHIKNPDLGTKKVAFSNSIYIEQEDAKSLKEGEEFTLMNWGNAFVRKVSPSDSGIVEGIELELHLEGSVKTTAKKLTWLSEFGQTLIPVTLVDFDYLLTKDKLEDDDEMENFLNPHTEFRTAALADENVKDLKKDDVIQFERKGYYRVDQVTGPSGRMMLFAVPTGKTK
ncbi:MAG: hypothetical protein M1814_001664 [Vezdaea aestivalis]|nr:MAG: hypothetical protein M1814_001664 [Vezdaea aestivalis]